MSTPFFNRNGHRSPSAEQRIPSLDGARAIAILLVIVAHLEYAKSLPPIFSKFDIGNIGVRVFFVLSGFLITRLLLAEREQSGAISLKAFWLRRILRIGPAFYVYLATIAALMLAGALPFRLNDIPIAALYVSNYADRGWSIGHTWSLAVEEQFYLIWPPLLVICGRRATLAAVAFLIAVPVFRFLATAGIWPTHPRYAFECVADALATGGLLAIVGPNAPPWYTNAIRSPVLLLLAVLIFGGGAFIPTDAALWGIVKTPAANVCIALLLDRYMRFPELPLGKMLNARPVVWTGALSYSLYLWQQIIVVAPIALAAKLVLILGAATASYYGVERPCLALRSGLMRSRAPPDVNPSDQPA